MEDSASPLPCKFLPPVLQTTALMSELTCPSTPVASRENREEYLLSTPSTPMFIPFPSDIATETPQIDCLASEVISSLSCGVASVLDRYRDYLNSDHFKFVRVVDFRVVPCGFKLALEAIVENDFAFSKEARIYAEGENEILSPFADSLGELLFGCAVSVTVEQNVAFRAEEYICVVVCRVTCLKDKTEDLAVGFGAGGKNDPTTASLKAICAALSHLRATKSYPMKLSALSTSSTASVREQESVVAKRFVTAKKLSWIHKLFSCR